MSAVGIKKEGAYKMTPGIYQVESILQRGRSGNQVFYLIKWKGYSEQEATWQPESNLAGCKDAILQFENIIKKMEEQKSQPEPSPAKTKKKSRKDKEKDKKFLTSQSKDLSQDELTNSLQPKKPQIQALTTSQPQKIKILNNQPQQLETKPENNPSNQQISQSQNDACESTTAQTTPLLITNRLESQFTSIDPKLQKNNLDDFKKTQFQNDYKKITHQTAKKSIKLGNFSKQQISENQKKTNLKRQREDSESCLQKNEKITQKIKKSFVQEEQIQGTQQQIFQITQKKEQSNKINFKVPSLLKCQQKQQRLHLHEVICPKLQNSEFIIKSLSRRSKLCDEEIHELKIEYLSCLDMRLTPKLKLDQEERKIDEVGDLMKKFIDLSSPSFSSITQNIKHLILSKDEIQNLDKEGDFLDCDIQVLAKIKKSEKDEKNYQWIAIMKNYEPDQKGEISNCYFVRIDDMRAEMWKKKFRKFLTPKS